MKSSRQRVQRKSDGDAWSVDETGGGMIRKASTMVMQRLVIACSVALAIAMVLGCDATPDAAFVEDSGQGVKVAVPSAAPAPGAAARSDAMTDDAPLEHNVRSFMGPELSLRKPGAKREGGDAGEDSALARLRSSAALRSRSASSPVGTML